MFVRVGLCRDLLSAAFVIDGESKISSPIPYKYLFNISRYCCMFVSWLESFRQQVSMTQGGTNTDWTSNFSFTEQTEWMPDMKELDH